MVVCLVRGADLHMAQRVPLPLTVSCSSKIRIGFTFLVPAHLGSPRKGPLNGCVHKGASTCLLGGFENEVTLVPMRSYRLWRLRMSS